MNIQLNISIVTCPTYPEKLTCWCAVFFSLLFLYSAAGCVFAFTSRVLYYYDALRGEFADRISPTASVLMPRTQRSKNGVDFSHICLCRSRALIPEYDQIRVSLCLLCLVVWIYWVVHFFCVVWFCLLVRLAKWLQSWTWVHFCWPNPIQSINSWIQSNPIHKVTWKSWPNPIQSKIAVIKANS